MLIDWFTVVAQAINFLVLVWLMKRFLYKPILKAIDAREKRIAAELADADARKTEAQKERDLFQDKNEEFDRERASLLHEAQNEVKSERLRLLDEAREAADTLRARQHEALRADAEALHQALTQRTQKEVFSIARKVLADLAETGLEERLSEVFVRRLGNMDENERAELSAIVGTGSDPVIVRSAFDLPEEQRAAIQKALHEVLSGDLEVRFQTAPNLISGIELTTNGRKVAWSIADYLASVEKAVMELTNEMEMPETRIEPASADAGAETKNG